MNNKDKSNFDYLEYNLPEYLKESIKEFNDIKEKIKNGVECYCCDISDLRSSINIAESGDEISKEQADYLRKKYIKK